MILIEASAYAQDPIILEYERVEKAFRMHVDGFAIDGTTESPRLPDKKWSLIAEWAASNSNNRPSMSANDMSNIINNLDQELGCDAIKLESGSYVVAVRQGEMGTFFIIAGKPGNYRVAWAVKDAAKNVKKDGLSRRAVSGAKKNPPYGSVGKLPLKSKYWKHKADGYPMKRNVMLEQHNQRGRT